ncbi:hypothetical protein ACFX2J_022064 [Malus domestica]
MERSTPIRKPHTSTTDLLTWSETPLVFISSASNPLFLTNLGADASMTPAAASRTTSFLLAPRSSSDPPPSGVFVSMVLTHYQGSRLQSQHGREVGELHCPSSSLHVKRPICLFHHYYTAFDEEDEDWRRIDETPGSTFRPSNINMASRA